MNDCLYRRIAAEALGSCILLATVVGSGIMADRLSTDPAVALLCNTLPTGAILFVLITVMGPISGAHFNPAVTLAFGLRREIAVKPATLYVLMQLGGAILGTWLAHAMFDMPLSQLSDKVRAGPSQWISEVVATFGLVFTILAGLRVKADAVPMLVGGYISAAYWFTASTSFANPAVVLARAFTDTFSGIRLRDVPAFMVADFGGALLALWLACWLFHDIDGHQHEPA